MTFAELAAFAGRNPVLSMLLAGLTVAILVTEAMRLLRGGQRLAPAALTALVNREDALVVDVRAAADFERPHPRREAAGAGRGEAGTQAAGRGEIAADSAGVQGRPERHGRRGRAAQGRLRARVRARWRHRRLAAGRPAAGQRAAEARRTGRGRVP